MKKINIKTIRIDGGTQSRVEIKNDVVAEYAEALSAGAVFPPVTVFFDGADNWLGDGFHRFHAYNKVGIVSIEADVRQGTQRDAKLFSLGANGTHGQPRTNADKRKAVTSMFDDAEWAKWSSNAIAKACGVSHTFVDSVRASILQPLQDATIRTVERNGKTYEQKVLKRDPKFSDANVKRPVDPPADQPQTSDELAESKSVIRELADENESLRDQLSVEQMDVSEEAKAEAENTISDLRAQIKTLEAEVDALKASRDGFQRQNAELMKQVQIQQKQLKKLGA